MPALGFASMRSSECFTWNTPRGPALSALHLTPSPLAEHARRRGRRPLLRPGEPGAPRPRTSSSRLAEDPVVLKGGGRGNLLSLEINQRQQPAGFRGRGGSRWERAGRGEAHAVLHEEPLRLAGGRPECPENAFAPVRVPPARPPGEWSLRAVPRAGASRLAWASGPTTPPPCLPGSPGARTGQRQSPVRPGSPGLQRQRQPDQSKADPPQRST